MIAAAITTPLALSDPQYAVQEAHILKSFPNACILWIEAIQHPTLQERYDAYRATLPPEHKELTLFHGSSEANIQNILRDGYKAALNRTSAYGKGTYFAARADYSKNYAHTPHPNAVSYMLVNKVAVANPCRGTSGTPIPAPHDAGVDNPKSPSIYVIPNDAAALPIYILAFYRNATT